MFVILDGQAGGRCNSSLCVMIGNDSDNSLKTHPFINETFKSLY